MQLVLVTHLREVTGCECYPDCCVSGASPPFGVAINPGVSIHGNYQRVFVGVDLRYIASSAMAESDDVSYLVAGPAVYGSVGMTF